MRVQNDDDLCVYYSRTTRGFFLFFVFKVCVSFEGLRITHTQQYTTTMRVQNDDDLCVYYSHTTRGFFCCPRRFLVDSLSLSSVLLII